MESLPLDKILANHPDPLDVLKSTSIVLRNSRHVRIHRNAISRAADKFVKRQIFPSTWNHELHFFDSTERTVNYLFLLDALNFCFWGRPRWKIEYEGKTLDGYWALAASLKRAAEENARVLDADYFSEISPEQLADILRGRGTIPLFVERLHNVRELGTVLRDHWNGSAAQLVKSAKGDAARLARLIAENFSSFDDRAVFQMPNTETRGWGDISKASMSPSHSVAASQIYFFKRAQIFVADLWSAFGGKQSGKFENIEQLTAFADYKLPQILRAWGILKYAPALVRKIDARVELKAGSVEEVEIRAATIWAVEFLRKALAERGLKWMSVEIDGILWQASQARHARMKPYHRVRTIYY